MSIKKVLLSKKISNVIYDIFPKTSADVVVYGDTTVSAALAEFANGLADVYTKTETDTAIKTSADNLYNKIMGITEEDGATVTEAYDTLKEVAEWIEDHGEVAAGLVNDIAALKTAVGDDSSGLIKAVADLQTAMDDNDADISDLQTAVAALQSAVGDAAAGLVKDVTDLKTDVSTLKSVVGDENSGLVKDVANLKAASTRVEASDTNGNIKVDGSEITVYTHPETHAATMIVEDDDHKFVTAAEKEAIANAAAVKLVASQDEVVTETDLYMIEIV